MRSSSNLPEFANDLVDADDHMARTVEPEADRIYVRIDHAPLPGPVLANAFVAVNRAAFHTVGPFHIGSHGGQRALQVAGIECGVGLFQQRSAGIEVRHDTPTGSFGSLWGMDSTQSHSLFSLTLAFTIFFSNASGKPLSEGNWMVPREIL
jgi:hypothetical protein